MWGRESRLNNHFKQFAVQQRINILKPSGAESRLAAPFEIQTGGLFIL